MVMSNIRNSDIKMLEHFIKALHDIRVLHRDMKSANVFLSSELHETSFFVICQLLRNAVVSMVYRTYWHMLSLRSHTRDGTLAKLGDFNVSKAGDMCFVSKEPHGKTYATCFL